MEKQAFTTSKFYPRINAFKYGFSDGLFNRTCKSPWTGLGWKAIRRNAEYLHGYMEGEEQRHKNEGKAA